MQALSHGFRVIEVEWSDLDLLSKGVGTLRMSCEGPDPFPHGEKSHRDVPARKPIGPGDHVQLG